MSTDLRGTTRWRVRTLLRSFVRLLLWVLPARPHVVISGMPTLEGNAIEMVRATAPRYDGVVYWLAPDPALAKKMAPDLVRDGGTVRVLAHRSPGAVLATVTARVVMFTHGVFGNPAPVQRKRWVNLWHGGGIKGNLMAFEDGEPIIRSHYLVAATRRIGEILAAQSRVPSGGLLVEGNPRVAQFARAEVARLVASDVVPGEPFVLWMPTYRRNRGQGLVSGWSETGDAHVDVNASMVQGVATLASIGVHVVVKPHPQDAENRVVEGATVITNEDLAEAGVQLYELIGAAAGLLTDYSSVWIDFLVLDRPIGFIVPDAHEYADGRGFNPPDALDWLPGPQLTSVEDFASFGRDVLGGGELNRDRRRDVATHWGHVRHLDAPDRILDDLDRDGAFRGRLRPRPISTAVAP